MKKILWIEDDVGIVEPLGLALEEEGYEVIYSENGKSGLEMALSIRPDLILLDILLPDINGFEVCRTLKTNKEYKSIPIIMVTALGDTENAVKGLSAGADDYISKAPNLMEFLARVKTNLKMKELYDDVKSEEKEKSALLGVSKLLSASLDPHETLYTICKKIAEVVKVKRCSILYVNNLNKEAYVMVSHDSRELKNLKINLDKYPEIQKVMETGRVVIINDVYNDPILFSERETLKLIDIKSIMAFPVAFEDALIGTLVLRTSRREKPFNDREIRFCELISHLAAAPLKNAHIFGTLHKEKEQVIISLREKETLLQEIYHRTKNNMQVICSLLNLQSKNVKDKQIVNILKETQNRIKSMALVHTKLYQSKDLSIINLKGYIEDLTSHLFKAYHIDSKKILLKRSADDILVSIDSAVPCGLIINEIIVNSLKYAFPNDREGEITIGLHTTDKGEIELRVADNGIGLPKEFDHKQTDSLGLQIVYGLVECQLDGKIDLNRENGVEFLIKFKEQDFTKRI